MTTLLKRLAISRALALASLAALAPLGALAQDGDNELAEIKREFLEIKTQLETVQKEAMETETVKDAIAKADQTLKSELLAKAPKKSETIEAYFEIRSEMAEAVESDSEEAQELEAKLKKLSSKLQGSLQKASKSEAVLAAQQDTKDAILAAMNQIEPETQQLIQEQSKLYARFQQLSSKGG